MLKRRLDYSPSAGLIPVLVLFDKKPVLKFAFNIVLADAMAAIAAGPSDSMILILSLLGLFGVRSIW